MRMREADLSDLYLLLKCYARTYCRDDDRKYAELFSLADEVNITYKNNYSTAVPIDQFRNARDAGRHKVYTDEFDSEIISLYQSGLKQSENRCSKTLLEIICFEINSETPVIEY